MILQSSSSLPSARSAISSLISKRRVDAKAIDKFLKDHPVPIAEKDRVTFIYRGQADAVILRMWIYGLPSAQPFQHLAGTDVWFVVQDLPNRSRVEYKLEVVDGRSHDLIEDPLNPETATDPFGANSVCRTFGYEIPDWTKPHEETRTGRLEEITLESKAFGDERACSVYLPARFRKDRRYPLLIAHDGPDYLEYSGFQTVLDNLIHRLEIPSMIVALTHPGKRLNEYANDDRHANFIAEELVPRLEEDYPLIGTPESRGLLGASFGAVAALSTAWRYPGMFGRLALQSGSFAFTDVGENERGPAFESVVEFVNAFRKEPTAISEKIFLSCGIYESLIYENRSLLPHLQSTGMDVRYVETRDGHNWENWRDTFREGLSWLFPGPLWMVYE